MPYFTSQREKRLWLWAGLITLTIFSTLAIAPRLVEELRTRDLLDAMFKIGFLLMMASIAWQGLMQKVGRIEIWVTMGVIGVALLTAARIQSPEERTHLFEYTVLAAFILQALKERQSNGRPFRWSPALIALIATISIGFLDEALQYFLPNRHFQFEDVFVNATSASLTISTSVIVDWLRKKWGAKKPL